MMFVVIVILLGLFLIAAALVARTHRIPGAHGKPRELPHRPAPGQPAAPGPRHRVDDAHTASISAADVRRRLEEHAAARDELMRQRAEA